MEMVSGKGKVVVVAMVVVMIGLALGTANGQKICGMTKEGFKACEPSVSSLNPNPPPPSAACCLALNDADLQCLCFFKNSKWSNGIDFGRATALPVQCNLAKSFHC